MECETQKDARCMITAALKWTTHDRNGGHPRIRGTIAATFDGRRIFQAHVTYPAWTLRDASSSLVSAHNAVTRTTVLPFSQPESLICQVQRDKITFKDMHLRFGIDAFSLAPTPTFPTQICFAVGQDDVWKYPLAAGESDTRAGECFGVADATISVTEPSWRQMLTIECMYCDSGSYGRNYSSHRYMDAHGAIRKQE
ncbi:hypothetical protein Q1695_006546 [Nippostrongylus brasiliensis]|nr:hypothetical protein Q1695_006546 [Nippostrongylus brasiliensis]